jgi:glycosyltransferase involved in cell wall biosynthesis
MIVKNEDRFVWYAINSVLPYVDKFIIFDTGSVDDTQDIIKAIRSSKIIFNQKKALNRNDVTKLRQEQVDKTFNGWIWIVDGDEIYPKKTAEKVLKVIKENNEKLGIIVHRYDLLGDIYHYQNENIGSYNQFNIVGHYVLRLIDKSKIPGLIVKGEYPNEFFADENGKSIKVFGKKYFEFIHERIFHASYLTRSTKKSNSNTFNRKKIKIEIGEKIKKNQIPEVFYNDKPYFIPDVTGEIDFKYKLKASIVTPLKKIKRLVVKP